MINHTASANLDRFIIIQVTRSLHSLQFLFQEIFKFSFSPCVMRHWNNLPEAIVSSTNFNDFKSLISKITIIVLVITQNEYGILVITRDRGAAEVEC